MTLMDLALLLFYSVFVLSVGFVLGFYWLKTQLESKMAGMFDMDLSQGFEDLEGDDL